MTGWPCGGPATGIGGQTATPVPPIRHYIQRWISLRWSPVIACDVLREIRGIRNTLTTQMRNQSRPMCSTYEKSWNLANDTPYPIETNWGQTDIWDPEPFVPLPRMMFRPPAKRTLTQLAARTHFPCVHCHDMREFSRPASQRPCPELVKAVVQTAKFVEYPCEG